MTTWEQNKQKVSECSDVIIQQFGFDPENIIKNEEFAKTDKLCQWLDIFGGCDWVIKNRSNQLYGIAVRVQLTQPCYYDDPHNTFSIRAEMVSGNKTELEKRRESIADGCFRPQYTLQCFMQVENPQVFLSGALIKTDDLYKFIADNPALVGSNKFDNTFQYVKWADLTAKGYPLIIK